MLFTLFTLFWCYLRFQYYFCKVDYFSVSDMLFSGYSNNLVSINRIPVIWVILSTHTLFLYVLADIYFYQVIYMLVLVLRNHYKEVHFLLLLCFIQFSYNIISLSLILVISVSISSSVSSCIHSYRLAYHSIELHNFECYIYIYNFALETLN